MGEGPDGEAVVWIVVADVGQEEGRRGDYEHLDGQRQSRWIEEDGEHQPHQELHDVEVGGPPGAPHRVWTVSSLLLPRSWGALTSEGEKEEENNESKFLKFFTENMSPMPVRGISSRNDPGRTNVLLILTN